MRRFKETEIQEMAEVLKDNGVISVPTDTVYGVCAIATSQVAQDNLRKVKNRPSQTYISIYCFYSVYFLLILKFLYYFLSTLCFLSFKKIAAKPPRFFQIF